MPCGSLHARLASVDYTCRTGGKIDWGHLAGDVKLYVNEKQAAQYKLLEEEPTQGPGGRGAPIPGLAAAGPPRGKPALSGTTSGGDEHEAGRTGLVRPAW